MLERINLIGTCQTLSLFLPQEYGLVVIPMFVYSYMMEKTFYGLEKFTEPNCFFVFVFKLGKVQSKRLNKEDLQSWWQDFDCLFCYLAVPVCHPQ